MTLELALIGKEFKRNKYGKSIWTDTVTEVNVVWRGGGISLKQAEVMVKGKIHWFKLDECLFIYEPMENRIAAKLHKPRLYDPH